MMLKPEKKKGFILGAICLIAAVAVVFGLLWAKKNDVATGPDAALSNGQGQISGNGSDHDQSGQDDTEKPGVVTLRIYTVDRDIGKIIDLYAQKYWDFEYELEIYDDSWRFGQDDIVRLVREEFDKNGGTDVDLYILPSWRMQDFVKGEYAKFACTYKELGIDVDEAVNKADIPRCIIEDGSNPDGELVALPYQARTVLFLYRRSVAREVWGTDDPDAIAEIIGSGTQKWDKFTEAAETLYEHEYYIVPGFYDLAFMVDASPAYDPGPLESFEIPQQWIAFMDVSKHFLESGYIKHTITGWHEWFLDLDDQNDKVFGFLYPTDDFQSIIFKETAGDWAACIPPFNTRMPYNSGIMVSKNSPHKELLGPLVKWITLDASDDGLQYILASGTSGIPNKEYGYIDEKYSVISGTVMKKVDGSRNLLGGQNINPMVHKALKESRGLHRSDFLTIDLFTGWRDAVHAYLEDEKDREAAIGDYLKEVRETGEVKPRPLDPSLSGSVILRDENFRKAVKDYLGTASYEMSRYSMAEVTELDLSGRDIENIEEIVYFKNLTKLNLSNNRITDISCLKELKRLREVNLSGNRISDLSPLSDKKYLRKLYLADNEINDISTMKGLPLLEVLDLSENRISYIGSLADFRKLKDLNLAHNRIRDIGVLKCLPRLRNLNLAGNRIDDRSPVAHVEHVQWD